MCFYFLFARAILRAFYLSHQVVQILIHIFSVSKNYNIDGTPRWNIARYCNHSCNPNSESEVKKKRVFVRAIKNIKEGEEICYDYGEEYFVEFLKGHCLCGEEKHLYSEEKKKK